jgi:hypothetical protein
MSPRSPRLARAKQQAVQRHQADGTSRRGADTDPIYAGRREEDRQQHPPTPYLCRPVAPSVKRALRAFKLPSVGTALVAISGSQRANDRTKVSVHLGSAA